MWINEEHDNPLNLAESYDELAQLSLGRGEIDSAREALEKAKQHYRTLGARVEGRRVQEQLLSLKRRKK